MTFVKPAIVALTVVMTASVASAKPPLSENEVVTEGLINVGMAFEISDKCNDLSPRYIRGISYLNSLKTHARSLGYSNAEIKTYTGDTAEEARLISIARERLTSLGAIEGDEPTYCAVGRQQIAQKTPIGRLLR